MQNHSGADTSIEQNNKDGSQGRNEEEKLGSPGELLGEIGAAATDRVEHDQSGNTQGSVDLGIRQVLQGVDNNAIRSLSSVDKLLVNTEELDELTGGNVDGRPSHEGANGRQRDELDNPAETEKSKSDNDATSDDGKGGSDNVSGDIRDRISSVEDDITGNGGHDSDGLMKSVFHSSGIRFTTPSSN